MKRRDDPRHRRRERAIQELFAYSFHRQSPLGTLATSTVGRLPEIDRVIQDCATEWPIAKINRVDLAILRLALAELMARTAPEKVIIDEAVELAKSYGSQASASFVNGVLGTALKKTNTPKTVQPEGRPNGESTTH